MLNEIVIFLIQNVKSITCSIATFSHHAKTFLYITRVDPNITFNFDYLNIATDLHRFYRKTNEFSLNSNFLGNEIVYLRWSLQARVRVIYEHPERSVFTDPR